MYPKIVNLRHEAYDIYIGRGTKWGNPFIINKDGNREEVIQKYEDYFCKNKYLLYALQELEDKILGCHCKPLACHGDILIKHYRRLYEE